MRRARRPGRALAAAFTAFTSAAAIGGCSSYPSRVALWNFLMPTPAFEPDARRVAVDELVHRELAWVALGHATTLVAMGDALVVTDPMVRSRLAVPGVPFGIGPRRITELPEVDLATLPVTAIVVSHDHPDHYDPASILAFHLDGVDVVLPPGIPGSEAERYRAAGARVSVLSWTPRQSEYSELVSAGATIRAFPVRHWGLGCSVRSQCANGYVLERGATRVAFFGDTAWRPEPPDDPRGFDLCLTPIGASYYRTNHIRPADAWRLHSEIGCRVTTPIHWRTFVDEPRPGFFAGDDDWRGWIDEPLCGLVIAADRAGRAGEVRCTRTGEVCTAASMGADDALLARCRALVAAPRQRARDPFEP